MEALLRELVAKCRKAWGDALISAVLYGSAAEGDHHAGYSDLNVLCILTTVTAAELEGGEDLFQWWRRQGNPAPLLLAEAELAPYASCFSIEFRDLQRFHRLLYGKAFAAPAVDRASYRFQLEHDLRARLLRFRQKAASAMSDDDLLRRLLVDSVATFCVLFRHAIELSGEEAPAGKRAVLGRAREIFGIDAQPFSELLDLREGARRPRELRPAQLLGGYLAAVAAVADAVSRLAR